MGYREGLAVGLAIGVPCALIFMVGSVLWFRNHRKLKKEDLNESEIDIGLKDDQLFCQFQDELHRPYNKNQANAPQGELEHIAEKPYQSSLSHGSSSSNFVDSRSTSLPQRPQHLKTASSYDFYETFIPILPHQNGNHHSSLVTINKESGPPATITENGHGDESRSSNISIAGSLHEKSLDNLAKQLNGPTFFEKLPSRAATMVVKPRIPMSSTNSSSDVIIETDLVNDTAMNDNFVYEAKAPVVTEGTNPVILGNTSDKTEHQETEKKGDNNTKLGNVLRGQYDDDFSKNERSGAASPFNEEEPATEVVFN
ncbi:uncharacterized protein PRCAT00002043001 [Priceomyces carsonii]|uniref:uncharacterized protein n=1 Tax=Priceomyces carsonii TaxID=28549 RepID=UPI002EDA7181|nr:unnamed protein product [Priceomyces carsonii]